MPRTAKKTDPEQPETAQNRRKRHSKTRAAIDLILKENPLATKAEIANKAVQIGAASHKPNVYKILSQKDYRNREIQAVEQANEEYLARLLVPKTLKQANKALNDKDLDDNLKFKYHNMIMGKGFADRVRQERSVEVNIGALQIQTLINTAMEPDEIEDNISDAEYEETK